MSGNRTMIQGQKGDLYCRPTTWLDVCKFFLLNYILHAFTVIAEPGAGLITSLFYSALAVFIPFSGIQYSSYIICQSIARCRNDLERAAKARALCFVMPTRFKRGELVSPSMTTVHGRFPIPSSPGWVAALPRKVPSSAHVLEAQEEASPYELVLVPRYASVISLLPEDSIAATGDSVKYQTSLASNSNIMKSAIAMLQIGYGSYELYDAYKGQLQKFGYAAYALTVVPYILMSFLNLAASLCQPGYNAMFLVHYRGDKDYGHHLHPRKPPGTFSEPLDRLVKIPAWS